MDDLVKRLREKHENWALGQKGPRWLLDAADRIEADAKRIAELERDVAAVLRREDDANVSAFGHLRRAADAEARVKVLKDALTSIAAPCAVSATVDWRAMYEAWRALCVERVDIARAALEGEKR